MTIEIPEDILASARLAPEDVPIELALALYAYRRLSIGKARELAGLSLSEFRHLAASRQIPIHLDVGDIEDEIADLNRIGRL